MSFLHSQKQVLFGLSLVHVKIFSTGSRKTYSNRGKRTVAINAQENSDLETNGVALYIDPLAVM